MAPLLDLANHSHLHVENGPTEADAVRGPKLCAVHLVEESAATSPKSGIKSDAPLGWRKRTFEVSAPKNAKIKKGDEIVFAYGPHSDETLFAEYGFVPLEGENPWKEVLLNDLINTEWREREGATTVALKKEVLEMNGYLKSVCSRSAQIRHNPDNLCFFTSANIPCTHTQDHRIRHIVCSLLCA